MAKAAPDPAPKFSAEFLAGFRDLVLWRRDVRRFQPDAVDPALVISLLELATHAPSVGNCQPWRFVFVDSKKRRRAIAAIFQRANAAALKGYSGEKQALYARLKLEGLEVAPVHIAVFADETTARGAGLGQQTMPETLRYSVVGAVQTLWLAARAQGLGMGWLSILEPEAVKQVLDVPQSWVLIGYLCLGWPLEEHLDPELERYGWQDRAALGAFIVRR